MVVNHGDTEMEEAIFNNNEEEPQLDKNAGSAKEDVRDDIRAKKNNYVAFNIDPSTPGELPFLWFCLSHFDIS